MDPIWVTDDNPASEGFNWGSVEAMMNDNTTILSFKQLKQLFVKNDLEKLMTLLTQSCKRWESILETLI